MMSKFLCKKCQKYDRENDHCTANQTVPEGTNSWDCDEYVKIPKKRKPGSACKNLCDKFDKETKKCPYEPFEGQYHGQKCPKIDMTTTNKEMKIIVIISGIIGLLFFGLLFFGFIFGGGGSDADSERVRTVYGTGQYEFDYGWIGTDKYEAEVIKKNLKSLGGSNFGTVSVRDDAGVVWYFAWRETGVDRNGRSLKRVTVSGLSGRFEEVTKYRFDQEFPGAKWSGWF